MLSVLVGKVSHAQSTQIIKFEKSLQYVKKEVKGAVEFSCR